MAEGFARHLGAGKVEAWSAGSKPAGRLNPAAVEAMREKGIDLSGHRSKPLSEVPSEGWDYVVTMGCGDVCPYLPSKATLDWALPDPKGLTIEAVRLVRDEIERRVAELLRQAAGSSK